MEIQQLSYFLAAAKYEHLTKAAEELNIAQPALSQSIKRLENSLGVSLFERSGRKISLNAQGELLQKRLEPIMDSLARLPGELQQSRYDSVHKIRLNIRAASSYITKFLIAYRNRHPDVNFILTQYDYAASCDIDITTELPDTELSGHYKEQLIVQEEIHLAVPLSSPLAVYEEIQLQQTEDEGYVLLSQNWKIRRICDVFCARANFTPRIVFESSSPETARNLISAGIGIGFWPPLSWGQVDPSRVKLLPIHTPQCRRRIIISMSAEGEASPVVRDFYNYISQCLTRDSLQNQPE